MASDNTIQFYINTLVDTSDLIEFLSNALGIALETLDYPDEQAEGFIMVLEYDVGFPLGVNVSWGKDVTVKKNAWEVAQQLAKHFNTLVATDFLEDDRSRSDPFCWWVADPKGTLHKVSEQMEQAEVAQGLVINFDAGVNKLPRAISF
jgi:hypothetical protein